jgi:hypothetical protein
MDNCICLTDDAINAEVSTKNTPDLVMKLKNATLCSVKDMGYIHHFDGCKNIIVEREWEVQIDSRVYPFKWQLDSLSEAHCEKCQEKPERQFCKEHLKLG